MDKIYNKEEVTRNLLQIQGWRCAVCCKKLSAATYHHTLHNIHGNRMNYPYFIDSHCNGKAVCFTCIGKDNIFVTTEKTAERYELFYKSVADEISRNLIDSQALYFRLNYIYGAVKSGMIMANTVNGLVEISFAGLVRYENPKMELVLKDINAIWNYLSR